MENDLSTFVEHTHSMPIEHTETSLHLIIQNKQG